MKNQLLENFLKTNKSVDIGFSEINLFDLESFDEHQIGYRVDTNGKSLLSQKKEDWQNDWFVIGYDEFGDPIIADLSDKNIPIYSSEHGQDEWELSLVSESIEAFEKSLTILREISIGRENPNKYEENPLPEKEKENALERIQKINKNIEIDWWKLKLDNDD